MKSSEYLKSFADQQKVTRLVISFAGSIEVIHEIAKTYITFDEIPVEIDAEGFLQTSFAADQILRDLVLKHLLPIDAEAGIEVVDLFCGRGTFTLPLSKYATVEGFDSDYNAIQSLEAAATQAERQITLHRRDLFISPLASLELDKYNFCVINPPRVGAKAQCDELALSNIEKIVYISCNPESFARDAKILSDGGYKLQELFPVDQFYWTPHIEMIGFFELVR